MKREAWIRLLIVALFALAIELLCRTRLIPPTVLIPPSDMVVELASILRSGELNADIVIVQVDRKETLRLYGLPYAVSRVRAAMFNAAINWSPIELD